MNHQALRCAQSCRLDKTHARIEFAVWLFLSFQKGHMEAWPAEAKLD